MKIIDYFETSEQHQDWGDGNAIHPTYREGRKIATIVLEVDSDDDIAINGSITFPDEHPTLTFTIVSYSKLNDVYTVIAVSDL